MNVTPKIIDEADKPLKQETIQKKKRVDINVLKARAQSIQNKENLKNSIIIIFFIMVLAIAGVYFSI